MLSIGFGLGDLRFASKLDVEVLFPWLVSNDWFKGLLGSLMLALVDELLPFFSVCTAHATENCGWDDALDGFPITVCHFHLVTNFGITMHSLKGVGRYMIQQRIVSFLNQCTQG